MQKRIDVKRRGPSTIFKKEALVFVSKWNEKNSQGLHIPKSWIEIIVICAACPDLVGGHFAFNFKDAYLGHPDLFAALLNHMRKKWAALEKSKSGKLKKFLSLQATIKWERGFGAKPDLVGNVCAWHLQDGELAAAFQMAHGGKEVTIADVRQARKWVVANEIEGEKYIARVLGKAGYIHLAGKPAIKRKRKQKGGWITFAKLILLKKWTSLPVGY